MTSEGPLPICDEVAAHSKPDCAHTRETHVHTYIHIDIYVYLLAYIHTHTYIYPSMHASAPTKHLKTHDPFNLSPQPRTQKPEALRPLRPWKASITQRPQSSSFLGLPFGILNMNTPKELLWGLWVVMSCILTQSRPKAPNP